MDGGSLKKPMAAGAGKSNTRAGHGGGGFKGGCSRLGGTRRPLPAAPGLPVGGVKEVRLCAVDEND